MTTRSTARAAALSAASITPVLLDSEGHQAEAGCPPPALAAALATATHVLATAPPPDPFLRWLLAGVTTGTSAGASGPPLPAAPSLVWAGVTSSTSVYGDRCGGRVDERTPVSMAGLSPTAARRLAGEAAWAAAAAAAGVPLAIFRLGGVYGPGRSALVSAVRADAAAAAAAAAAEQAGPPGHAGDGRGGRGGGEDVAGRGQEEDQADLLLVNRVHVGDAAALILAAAVEAGVSPRSVTAGAGVPSLPSPPVVVYNAVDAVPASRAAVFAAARSHLARPGVAATVSAAAGRAARRPRGEAVDTATAAVGGRRARERMSKAVDGEWSYTSLGVARVYRGYQEGLAALAGGEPWPFGGVWTAAALS
ncbi:hypothetical protein MMPV_004530 [Pyropia vietnamensis]